MTKYASIAEDDLNKLKKENERLKNAGTRLRSAQRLLTNARDEIERGERGMTSIREVLGVSNRTTIGELLHVLKDKVESNEDGAAVSLHGKLRTALLLPADATEKDIIAGIMSLSNLALAGKQIVERLQAELPLPEGQSLDDIFAALRARLQEMASVREALALPLGTELPAVLACIKGFTQRPRDPYNLLDDPLDSVPLQRDAMAELAEARNKLKRQKDSMRELLQGSRKLASTAAVLGDVLGNEGHNLTAFLDAYTWDCEGD